MGVFLECSSRNSSRNTWVILVKPNKMEKSNKTQLFCNVEASQFAWISSRDSWGCHKGLKSHWLGLGTQAGIKNSPGSGCSVPNSCCSSGLRSRQRFEPAQNSWLWEVLVLSGISRAVHRKHDLFQPFLCPIPACHYCSCPGVFLWLPEPSSHPTAQFFPCFLTCGNPAVSAGFSILPRPASGLNPS